jgi:hypothetical protein
MKRILAPRRFLVGRGGRPTCRIAGDAAAPLLHAVAEGTIQVLDVKVLLENEYD